ncbi:uncharacterized protein [Antedon mediterranea]|uniref:uncharacterized protein n=1 Tax=Antedon mediterranea TaxID=105859 RepID=UPI003AF55A50
MAYLLLFFKQFNKFPLYLSLSAISTLDSKSVCPSGWSGYGSYCYQHITSRVYWGSGVSGCRGKGSGVDIVSIHSSGENTFVGQLISTDAWIGMTEDDDEDYYWKDGTHDNVHYWSSGQPNLDGRWHDADCVKMQKSNYRWNDEECNDNVKIGYVCKTAYCNVGNCKDLSFNLSPRSCRCSSCNSQYYLASGISCPACTVIQNCDLRSCTTSSNQVCMKCNGDYGTAKGQAYLNKNTVCEENCSWRSSSTLCYPGTCPDGEKSCTCTAGFSGSDCRTMTSSATPTMDYCLSKIHDTSGGTIELQCVDSGHTSYVRQLTLTNIENDWRSSYTQPNVQPRPPYISGFALGMIRGVTVATIYNKGNTNSKEVARIPCSDSADKTAPEQNVYHCVGMDTLDLTGWTLTTGDRMTIDIEVENGGYVTVVDRDTNVQSNRYYNGRILRRNGNYIFDFIDPAHCVVTTSCSLQTFNCGKDVTKEGNISVSWSGWTDPDSDIKRYRYEIRQMSVQSNDKLEEVLTGNPVATGDSNGGTYITLPHPGLYSVVLEVFDLAGNVQLARRFILFDDNHNVTFKKDTVLQVTSASPDTGFEWLTDLQSNVLVDWTNHYINEFHNVNKLLNEIGDYFSSELLSEYDQWTGTRGRNAIPNKLGVVKFEDTFSLDHSGCSSCNQGAWSDVGLSTSESYNIPRIDGDSITFWVRGTDIMGNTLVDSVKVHVDSSEAIIDDLFLSKDGERSIAVHNSADLLEMNFEFQSFDAHSGLKTIHWELYDMHEGTSIYLGSDHLSANHISDPLTCHPPDCICIPKGDCYGINYSFKPDLSRMNISNVKHDQEIYLKITVTNYAMLVTNLTRKITIDTSPPHEGTVSEGISGENEIDFQQELKINAHWSGFFDKESGIKYYKYGISDNCLTIDDFYNTNMTIFTTTSKFATWTASSPGKYYCTVVAFNNAVDPSNPVCSDGVTVDSSPPTLRDVIVENLYIRPGLVTINDDNSTVWFISPDLKRSLVESPSEECSSSSRKIDEATLSMIPVLFSNGTINMISDLECLKNKPLPMFLYLREDRYLSFTWNGADNESEIFVYSVGLSSTPSDVGPDLMPFKSTGSHPMFKTYHPHLGEGVAFYIVLKAINRAKIATTRLIGPIIVDVTPPSFTDIIYVSLVGEYLLAEWNSDCFIDEEDDEPLTYHVAVGHSKGTSELLPFQPINTMSPCTFDATKLCTAIPLSDLDWELHVNHLYFVSIKAINVAGLSTIGVSDPYYHNNALPTLGVVFDISVRQTAPTPFASYVDIDCQSETDALAVYWYGFQSVHDDVSYQVAVGTNPEDSDVTKGLVDVGYLDYFEIKNLNLLYFKMYYTTIIATSSAGSVNVSSDGVNVLPKDAFIYGTIVADGEPCSDIGSCVEDVDFQSSTSSYSLHWQISNNMTSLITHIIWTLEKEVDVNNQIWKTLDGPENLGFVSHILTSGLELEYGGHYRSKVEFCNSDICFNPLFTDGSWVLSVPPTASRVYVELVYKSDTHIEVAFEPFYQDAFQQSLSIDTMDHYEWSLTNGEEGNGMILPWQQVVDMYEGDEMITFQAELTFNTSTFTCIKLLVRGFNKAGLSSTTSTELWDCDKAQEANPNFVIDAIGNVELEENDLWEKEDVDYSLQKTSLHAVWPTLRYLTYEWAVIGVSPLEFTTDFDLEHITKPCAHPNTIKCGETDAEYINVDELNLKHGSKYFICIHAEKTTKYHEKWTEYLPELSSCSDGVVIDHTPPTQGDVWLGWKKGDRYQHSMSDLSITWDSFVDVEEHGTSPHHSGIKYYEYSLGTYPGGIDVIDFVKVGITEHLIAHNLNLINGRIYYATIKATDFVGLTLSATSQGITVDSTPPVLGQNSIVVDGDVFYSTSHVEASWDGVFIDHESGISTYEWSIGSQPFWSDMYPNTKTTSEGAITNENYDLNLQEGHHYYITVKCKLLYIDGIPLLQAYNGAGLSAMMCSGAVTVDTSPPSAGFVYDGQLVMPPEDKDTQQETSTIFANWGGFVDRGTQVIGYSWKVGLCPGCDDVMEEQNVGLATDGRVNYLNLVAGHVYYTTVTACDAADLCTEVISDGILIDNSPPVAGFVFDGSSGSDINFQNSRRVLEAHWWGFNDPHSGLSNFEWWAGTTPGGSDILDVRTHHLSESAFTTLNFDLPLNTKIFVTVKAYNKVGLSAKRTSDGFIVDVTPPKIIKSIEMSTRAGVAVSTTQVLNSVLRVNWEFDDSESGIRQQYLSVFTHNDGDVDVPLTKIAGSEVDYSLTDLALHDGSRYQVKVVACNGAELCNEMSSKHILVDSTPPTVGTFAIDTDHAADLDRHQSGWMTWRQISPGNGILNLAWLGFVDAHSGVNQYRFTIGSSYSASDLSPDGTIVVIPNNSTVVVDGDEVFVASVPVKGDIQSNVVLYISLWAVNGVGLSSLRAHSAFEVVSSGVVNEGTLVLIRRCSAYSCEGHCTCAPQNQVCLPPANANCQDITEESSTPIVTVNDVIDLKLLKADNQNIEVNYTLSRCMLAATWSIDASSTRTVERYEWSAGDFSSTPKQPKGIFNAAVDQVWFDVGQETSAVLMLDEDKLLTPTFLYYFYIRAWYSYDSYAIYRSNGITVDVRPPDVTTIKGITVKEHINETFTVDTDFLTETDHVSVSWRNVFRDESGGISHFEVSISTFPGGEDVRLFLEISGNIEQYTFITLTLKNGQRYFTNVRAYNHAGLHTLVVSDGFIVDLQTPVAGTVTDGQEIHDVEYQSSPNTIKTSWHGFIDFESFISHIESCIGETTSPTECNIKIWKKVKIGNSATTYLSKNLTTGLRYFAKVRSYDAAGHVSPIAVSDGFVVDTTPPVPIELIYYGENILTNPSFEDSLHTTPWIGHVEDTPNWISEELLPTDWHLSINSSIVVYSSEQQAQDGILFVLVHGGLTQSVKTEPGHHYMLTFHTHFVTSSSVPLIMQEAEVKVPGIHHVFKLYNTDNVDDKNGDIWQKHVYFFTAEDTESAIVLSTVSTFGMMLLDNVTVSTYSYSDNNKHSSNVVGNGAIQFKTQIIRDWSSVHAIWHFIDPESPIVDYTWAIGTIPGGTQVQGFKSTGSKKEGINSDITLQNGVKIYITVIATNAADLSTRVISAPLTIDMTEPVVDFVYDGLESNDIDFQTNHDIVVTWSALDAESGIYLCEWAIGYNPYSEDIQEYREVNCDDGFGITLLNDTKYENVRLFSTMKFHNNAGMSSRRSSDGVVIVTRPPIAEYANVRVLISSPSPYTQRGYYQSDTSQVEIGWDGFYDPVNIVIYECCIGTNSSMCIDQWVLCGTSDDTHAIIEGLSLNAHFKYSVFVRAVNQVNMTSKAVASEFATEPFPPLTVNDVKISWPTAGTVKLDWNETFQSNSSLIYELSLGKQDGASDVAQWLETSEQAILLNNIEVNVNYFLTLTAINCAGLDSTVNATFYQIDIP